ncbi:MAG: hypothetical protein DRJ31_00260 [Candidatus Methanomethylicota archaeon]|uniref:UPF0179 protein DRJ31_00260 n=1 Tax=Thermoproteota archaeon TaxID=2056631 RepID=A0A497ETP9_9CREN|nr:MAG: hypothetical protein DRJ31_00260 [Candidatus Verstraetearchaeota archaeon]
MAKRLLTFVGVKQARVGYKFVFEKPLPECKQCDLYHVCMENIEPGRTYVVVGVRSTVHSCPIHEGGVRVVEVQEAEIEAAIKSQIAIEGETITFNPIRCNNTRCPYISLCMPIGLRQGDRCKVLRVSEKIKDPPCGLPLIRVFLQRV